MFDERKFANVQEFGLSVGARDSDGPGPGGLCIMQALNFCTGGAMNGCECYMCQRRGVSHILADRHPQVPDQVRNTLVFVNDAGDKEDRDWLMSLLPRIAELLPEMKSRAASWKANPDGVIMDNIDHASMRISDFLGVEPQVRKTERGTRSKDVFVHPYFAYGTGGSIKIPPKLPTMTVSGTFVVSDVQVWFDKFVTVSLPDSATIQKTEVSKEEALCPA